MDTLRGAGSWKYEEAVLIAEILPLAGSDRRQQVRRAVTLSINLFASEVREFLMEAIKLPPSLEGPSLDKHSRDGWIYVGILYEGEWEEKYFDWQGDGKAPEKGDVLTAAGSVNIRQDVIKYDRNAEVWKNARIVGLVKPGDRVQVKQVETVADDFVWIRAERLEPGR